MYVTSRIVTNVVTFSLVLYTVGNAAPTRLRGSIRDDKVDDHLPVSSSGDEGGDDGDYYYDTMDNATVEDIRNGQAFALGALRSFKSAEYSVEPPSQPQGKDEDSSDGDYYDPVDNSTLDEIQSGPSFALGAQPLGESSFDPRSEGPEEDEDVFDGDYYYNSTVEAIETSLSFAVGAKRPSRSSEYSLETGVEAPEETEDGADGDYYYDTMDNSTVGEIQSGQAFASGAITAYKSLEYSSEVPSEAAEENADDSDVDYYDPIDNSTSEGVPSRLSPSLGAGGRWGCYPICSR
jgi:hypothetical protein